MPFGDPGVEKVSLNIDSLWSGGPFEDASYAGGNPASDLSHYLPAIRQNIFEAGTGNVSGLLGSSDHYGLYQVYANLSVEISSISSVRKYNRSLSLDTGLHTTSYTANDGNTYITTIYCSYPDQVCIYDLSSSAVLPEVRISLEDQLRNPSLFKATCGDQYIRLTGFTQLGLPLGMKYDGVARLSTQSGKGVCSNTTAGMIVIPGNQHNRKLTLVFGAGTNYDQTAGNAAHDFSFKGTDPSSQVEAMVALASAKTESSLRSAHIADYRNLTNQFELTLPDTAASASLETSVIIDRYNSSSITGDPYLESTLFSLGRHLFISSQRDNSLPSNLAGLWSNVLDTAWSGDYHANINFQMNQWGLDQTGLGALQVATFNYIANTWVPRGTETALLLYGAPGWVVHDEVNIFGHTAMKEQAEWANYPASAAWMLQHVYDHFSYSGDAAWFTAQGYPLLKGVAQFWLSQLQPDLFAKDGSLVVNPCNSPEHGPTTFGCANYQQLIHQLFTNILSSLNALPNLEHDAAFIKNLTNALKKLDKGLHIGSWGELKEWKIPDSYGFDVQGDTHRHLSQLVGWYPGYSVSSFLSGYSDPATQNAVRTTLISRGAGSGSDADSGWEKVWRSACWSMLNATTEAYYELKFAIDENFAHNGLSMYWGTGPLFQIDANFGFIGATLAMLVVDLPGMEEVVLGPAIPTAWAGGSVKGLRLREGGLVSFGWDKDGIVQSAVVTDRKKNLKILNKLGKVLIDI